MTRVYKYVRIFLVLMFGIFLNSKAQVQIVNAFPNLSFNSPIDFQTADDGSNMIYVVERNGIIKKFNNSISTNVTTTFLDINVSTTGEGGLLGLAFHPDFENNGLFFVHYTIESTTKSLISRFSVDNLTNKIGDLSTEVILLEVDQPATNHNAGQLAFGADGYLYIAFGDGGGSGDPNENGQDPTTLLGTILRIDVDNTDPGLNYAIPADNPFVGMTGRDEIYAYGFRNPYRFSFDNETGSLLVADVGESTLEEIDKVESGKNYGWDIIEASICHEPESECDMTGLELPIFEYGRDDGGSITGGRVYRGSRVSSLKGRYVYGDFVSGNIWSFNWNGSTASDNQLIGGLSGFNLVAFGQDQAGELYICSFDGSIYTFISEDEGQQVELSGTVDKDGWRFLGSPRIDESFASLLSGVWTQGAIGASTTSGDANMLLWEESGQQFQVVTDLNDVTANGTGFIGYIYEDDDPTASGTQGGWPKTLTSSGTLKTGITNFPISYTTGDSTQLNGFNLVANPYPVSIDWEAASGWTKTNIADAIYIWDPNANSGEGTYRERVGGVGDNINLIAPFQAFFVQATAPGAALSVTEAVQTTGGIFLKSPLAEEQISSLKLILQTDGFQDQTYLAFNGKSLIGKDHLDAIQLPSLAREKLELYSETPDGLKLAINSLSNNLADILEIPLHLQTTRSGAFHLRWKMQNLPIGWGFTLKDTQTGRLVSLNTGQRYRFEVLPPSGSVKGKKSLSELVNKPTGGTPRFILRINPGLTEPLTNIPMSIDLKQNYPNPFNPSTVIRYQLPVRSEVRLEVYDMLGRRIATLFNGVRTPGRYEVSFDASNLASGLYLSQLKVGNSIITRKMTLIK